jgi:hypothetical protein
MMPYFLLDTRYVVAPRFPRLRFLLNRLTNIALAGTLVFTVVAAAAAAVRIVLD